MVFGCSLFRKTPPALIKDSSLIDGLPLLITWILSGTETQANGNSTPHDNAQRVALLLFSASKKVTTLAVFLIIFIFDLDVV